MQEFFKRVIRSAFRFGAIIFLVLNSATILGQELQPASTSLKVLIPHANWDCGLPDGILPPESGKLVLEFDIKAAEVFDLGKTQYGHRIVVVTEEGSFRGGVLDEEIQGVLVEGSLDLVLKLPNGMIEVEQLLNLKTRDGKHIFVRTAGVGTSQDDLRIVCHFEAPSDSRYDGLNNGVWLARREFDETNRILRLKVYEGSKVPIDLSTTEAIRIEKPEATAFQTWDYRVAEPGEVKGDEIITENVTLGPSLMVGRSKGGMRNTIPITGGDLRGKIQGKVLRGGADYQQLSPSAAIDARYLWRTEDGEIVLVRNAGAFGRLVPTFETRVDGPYAWLNTKRFLSSNPGMGSGGVKLTFYESR